MTPQAIEQAAERAYGLFRAQHPNEPEWADFPHKHIWHDRVTAYQATLATGAPPANFAEECVKAAYEGASAPVDNVPDTDELPKIEEVTAKPKKAWPKK